MRTVMQRLRADEEDEENTNEINGPLTSQATVYFSAPNNYSSKGISESNNKPDECAIEEVRLDECIIEEANPDECIKEEAKPDQCNIEEAESSLQRSDSLNCEVDFKIFVSN